MTNQTADPQPEAQDADPVDDPAAAPAAPATLDPQVAAELAQELSLIARALYAQLLPETAPNAIAGIPEMGTRPGTVTQVAAERAAPAEQLMPTSAAGTVPLPPAPIAAIAPASEPVALPVPASVPIPTASSSSPAAPVTPPPPAAPAPAPTAALPVPGLPVERPAAADDEPPVAPRPVRSRSTAVLEEIAFLDE